MAARSQGSSNGTGTGHSHGFTTSDVGERSSPRFPSSAATEAKSQGSKSFEPRRDQPDNSAASENQQLFYSDVGGYIPAAGIGIANQVFQTSYRSRQARSSPAEPGSSGAFVVEERKLSHTYIG